MSKKFMKRSLALGALMAFVITGSAWAAEAENNFPSTGPYLGPLYMDKLAEAKFDSAANYHNIYISSPNSFGVSMVDEHELKASKSIVISSYSSGIASENKGWAKGSVLTVSAPDIVIKDIKQDKRSGIHLDADGSCVIIQEFDKFTISPYYDEVKKEYSATYGIRVDANAQVFVKGDADSVVKIGGGSSGIVLTDASTDASLEVSAGKVEIVSNGCYYDGVYKGQAVANTGGTIKVSATDEIVITNTRHDEAVSAVYSKGGAIYVGTTSGVSKKADIKIDGNIKTEGVGKINLSLETDKSVLNGSIKDESIAEGKGTNLLLSNGAIWNNNDLISGNDGISNVAHLTLQGGVVKQGVRAKTINVGTLSGNGTFEVTDGTAAQMVVGVKDANSELTVATRNQKLNLDDLIDVAVMSTATTRQLITAADYVEKIGGAIYEKESAVVNEDGSLEKVTKVVDDANIAANDMASVGLMSYRAEMNDMNKRMGELRNANGEHGVWVRMVRGESEYNRVKNQYNQYQLGYDEKLSVDKRWTVGAALSYTDAQNNFERGSGESTNKALAIYGSKLNEDGTFVDLIAKYARLENEFDMVGGMGSADYDTNGYSFSAEIGKRIQQGKGLWIEPQVELTYGKVSAVDYVTANNINVAQDGMESLVGRIGFALGKDVKDGNVYARASYLYDFDGETKATLNDDAVLSQDLGGGWWEVGVGANINLSKATYIYADVEKTFGGEVDTNWQWNLGVRYSF